MRKSSSFLKRALGLEQAGIFGDMEDIDPADKIGDHLGPSKVDFKRIIQNCRLLAKKNIPIFKSR